MQDTQRLFEGEALMQRMYEYGLLEESQNKLDNVLLLMQLSNPCRRIVLILGCCVAHCRQSSGMALQWHHTPSNTQEITC